MSRISFKYGIQGITGNLDGLVIYYSPRRNRMIARRYVMPELTEHNRELGAVQKHLGRLWREVSEEYKQDLRIYGGLKAQQDNKPVSAFIIFAGMCKRWAKAATGNDILRLTRQRIIEEELPLRSVNEAVLAGLLRELGVGGYGDRGI